MAGTIGASLNGSGVVGVAPAIQIMAVKFIDDSGDCGTDAMAIEAIDYAASFDVPIINASWGGSQDSNPLENAIDESNALFVAAAGNAGRNIDSGDLQLLPGRIPARQRPERRGDRPAREPGALLELRSDHGRRLRPWHEHLVQLAGGAGLFALLGMVRRHVDGGTARQRASRPCMRAP